jgi:hypothetical protein
MIVFLCGAACRCCWCCGCLLRWRGWQQEHGTGCWQLPEAAAAAAAAAALQQAGVRTEQEQVNKHAAARTMQGVGMGGCFSNTALSNALHAESC